MTLISLSPRDPLIARDSRPFQAGSRARTLPWPYPSVITGSLRTLLGKQLAEANPAQAAFQPDVVEALKQIQCSGPWAMQNQQLFFAMPQDLVFYEDDAGQTKIMKLEPVPFSEGAGALMPHPELWPMHVTQDVKPTSKGQFCSAELLYRWLSKAETSIQFADKDFIQALQVDERIHVKIDPTKQRAEDSHLFVTSGLVFPDVKAPQIKPGEETSETAEPMSLLMQAHAYNSELQNLIDKLNHWHPVGGERRLSRIQKETVSIDLSCPPKLKQALEQAKGLRMFLTTPGIFTHGWRPEWLNQNLEGTIPGTEIQVRLRGACLGRYQPISGWSLEKGRRGPKAIRRMVPAGSVYFFEVLNGKPEILADKWLQHHIGDTAQDNLDGFSEVIWGRWN